MIIEKVGVVGCGLMGAGIAQVAAQSGYTTVVREINQELLDKGLGHISAFLDKGVEKRKMTPEKRDETWALIQGTTDLADMADCDLVIEAIFEDLNAKQELFEELDGICKEETVFATNTSSLSVAKIGERTNRMPRVVGLHYFFPSVINQLIEVIETEDTTPEVTEALLNFSRSSGKIPIRVKDAPGFAVNRYFVPILNEAVRMLDEGLANIPTIDQAACESIRMGMGPFALMNATGIPIAYHCTQSFMEARGEFYGPATGLASQFESGGLWNVEGDVEEAAKSAVGDRFLGVVFGVAAALAEEGVASIEDIDHGAMIGLRWARGPFGMMNDAGLGRALELVKEVASDNPSFYVPELLRNQAASSQPWEIREVKLEVKDGIATVRMCRPEAMNALNEKVLTELKEIVARLGDDPSVRVVIVTGEGPAFVAGADIKTMLKADRDQVESYTRFGQGMMDDVEKLNKPVIAAINGYALGGGLELALACDIRIASTEARMGFPEVGLGIFPGFGGTQRCTRLIGKGGACELIFTGEHITAEKAAQMGLVNRVVPPRQLMMETRALAGRIAEQGPLAVGLAKQAINQALQTSLEDGLEFELNGVMKGFGSEDQKEGMTAFLERRKPEFSGQ
jgi:enoyl-CoA hydratase/3-hydroxyacyl-CoA dehydrogenase